MADNGDKDRRELFLIDGNSIAYRAFFALPDSMATADGRPTNAIFGLASMMVKLISDYRPAQLVVAWDAGMSGREIVYPEYKSHRSAAAGPASRAVAPPARSWSRPSATPTSRSTATRPTT